MWKISFNVDSDKKCSSNISVHWEKEDIKNSHNEVKKTNSVCSWTLTDMFVGVSLGFAIIEVLSLMLAWIFGHNIDHVFCSYISNSPELYDLFRLKIIIALWIAGLTCMYWIYRYYKHKNNSDKIFFWLLVVIVPLLLMIYFSGVDIAIKNFNCNISTINK